MKAKGVCVTLAILAASASAHRLGFREEGGNRVLTGNNVGTAESTKSKYSCSAEPIRFQYNKSVPYTFDMQKSGAMPFAFAEGCMETQQCPGMTDAQLWNIRLAAVTTSFPIFENKNLPDLSPADGKAIVENAKILFDDETVAHIHGYTTLKGPTGIGSYLAVPHSKVSGITTHSDISHKLKLIGDNSVLIDTKRYEEWTFRPTEPYTLAWRYKITYYPCSAKVKSLVLKLPQEGMENFITASQQPGVLEEVCQRITTHCTGEHEQYHDFNDCIEYMTALPLQDPICQHKMSPFSVMGNSYMCKYLHQFMTPFEPEFHCYHSGKGRFDVKGLRKCVPTDCYDENTPRDIVPTIMFPPDAVTAETYFKHQGNGTFVEALIEPETPRLALQGKNKCTEKEAIDITAATILSLPMCMPSLGTGSCSANCTQAVAMLLGRFSENGSLCRCKNDVIQKSAMLKTLQVDAEVLMQLAYSTLTNVELPACIVSLDLDVCHKLGTYRGKAGCKSWNFNNLEKALYNDWGQEAQYLGRITQSDIVASAECIILSGWQQQVKSRDLYYGRNVGFMNTFPDYPTFQNSSQFIQIHPSKGPVEVSYEGVLNALRSNQTRSISTIAPWTCSWGGGTKEILPSIIDNARTSVPVLNVLAYDTGTEMHLKTRQFISESYPGLLGEQEPGHTFSDILKNVGALHNFSDFDFSTLTLKEIGKLALEVSFRGFFRDKLPYVDKKLGDDLEGAFNGAPMIPDYLSSIAGNFKPAAYKAAMYQIQQLLQNSGTLTVDRMENILRASGLDGEVASEGPGSAYLGLGYVWQNVEMLQLLIDRIRHDECEMKHLWGEVGSKEFILEHLRLTAHAGFQAKTDVDQVERMYQIASAHRDPSVFEDPLDFNPKRSNLHQVLAFGGLEQEFDEESSENGYFSTNSGSTLKRGCPGRHFSMKFFQELAPFFFPKESSEYTCHDGMRAWYGVKFKPNIITFRNGIQLEVLKVNGQDSGQNLMIFLHGLVDVPLGWAKLIEKMRGRQSRHSMDYWAAVMPGWGGKGSRIEEQCDWPVIGSYIADLLIHAKSSYNRVFLFGRGDGGYIAQYAANQVGKEVLHGLITDALPPALFAADQMSKPLDKRSSLSALLNPIIADTILTSDVSPLLNHVKNASWWNDAWEWEFRAFQRKTGGKQISCQARSNWDVGADGLPSFNNFDAARNLDPNMHMLTFSHELDLLKPDSLMRYGLKQTSPQPGIVQRFEQIREKPDMLAHFYKDEPTEELARIVSSFVDQSIEIRYSIWARLTKAPDFHKSAYREDATRSSATFFSYTITFAIMLTGIIMELTLGVILAGKLGFGAYLFSQVMAATINFGCFFAADLITIPLYTLGLFKLGYPEVTSKLIAPLKHPEFFYNNIYFRYLSFISGVAYLIHHSGGTLLYMVVSLHEMDALSLGSLALAVGFQHLSVFVKYTHPLLHAFILLALEIWFQLEAYYALTFATNTAKVGIMMLLVSHYIWFVHGCVSLFMDAIDSKSLKQQPDTKKDDGECELSESTRQRMDHRKSLHMFRRLSRDPSMRDLTNTTVHQDESTEANATPIRLRRHHWHAEHVFDANSIRNMLGVAGIQEDQVHSSPLNA